MLKNRTFRTGTAALVLMGAVGFGPALASANAAPAPTASIVAAKPPAQTGQTVTGTIDGTAFTGEVSNLTTSVVDGVLTLTGTLTGPGQLAEGVEFTAPIEQVTTTAANGTAAGCEILNLVLGPLDLNLLGLEVFLDTVTLDITAVPGAGNLLGNLLCAVAGLLDGPAAAGGALNGIAALLNRLLTGLGL